MSIAPHHRAQGITIGLLDPTAARGAAESAEGLTGKALSAFVALRRQQLRINGDCDSSAAALFFSGPGVNQGVGD